MELSEPVLRIKRQFNENNNSHIFLVETNNENRCLSELKELIKEVLDIDECSKHQIENEEYLELIIIRPEGKEIKKDAILYLQERIKTKPIISDKIFYIIISSEKMNVYAGNKLLKTIEEPNDGVFGFLITTNSDLILPTIKSRCESIKLIYKENITKDSIEEEYHDEIKELIISLENHDHLKFTKFKSNEKLIKDNFKIVEKYLKSYYNTASNLTKDDQTDKEIIDLIRKHGSNISIKKASYINSIFNKLTQNMNNELLLEKIFIEIGK